MNKILVSLCFKKIIKNTNEQLLQIIYERVKKPPEESQSHPSLEFISESFIENLTISVTLKQNSMFNVILALC